MKTLTALVATAVVVVVASANTQKVIPLNFGRQAPRLPPLHKRAGTYSQELNNNITVGGYYAQVSVGTPPQTVDLVLDTGSSDVWLLDSSADLCRSARLQEYYGHCISTYDPANSSTYSLVSSNTFDIQYVDGSGAEGDYIKDTFDIGGASIKDLQMGVAKSSLINSGLLGIGFAANVVATVPYPNIITLFQDQGLIAIQAYSLYLNDLQAETGTILFGGIDTEKFIGNLETVRIQKDRYGNYTSFTVALSSIVTTAGNGTVANYLQSAIPVILDSGTTLTYLPSQIANRILDAFGAVDDTTGSGLVYVDCDYLTSSQNLTFDFQFGGSDGPLIRVPIDEIILDNVDRYLSIGVEIPGLPFDNACSFGIQSSADYYLLGDTFLRSAYVVYDLTNKEIALAQANLNSTETNVVEITEDSGIPDASGVASQVTVEQTATGQPGDVGGDVPTASTTSPISTSDATATDLPNTESSQSTTTTTGSNAGVRAVPAPNWEAAVVAAISGVFGLLGAGLVVL
ncbi:aspartic peptidase domain-containing protein [Xylariaceae sp. FL0662B]|nr:aspartic peptidase domain-containing protein [Xylariaceae sp. FL0662B]